MFYKHDVIHGDWVLASDVEKCTYLRVCELSSVSNTVKPTINSIQPLAIRDSCKWVFVYCRYRIDCAEDWRCIRTFSHTHARSVPVSLPLAAKSKCRLPLYSCIVHETNCIWMNLTAMNEHLLFRHCCYFLVTPMLEMTNMANANVHHGNIFCCVQLTNGAHYGGPKKRTKCHLQCGKKDWSIVVGAASWAN